MLEIKKNNKYTDNYILHFNRTKSNIFFTLIWKNNVMFTVSSGSSNCGKSKREKIVPQVIELILKKLVDILNFNKIEKICLKLITRISKHLDILLKELYFHEKNVILIMERRLLAHNGVRQKKLRRV